MEIETMRFSGKVAIVTGGGTGIGKAVAAGLVREGAQVVINGRRADVLKATAAEIDASGARVHTHAGDIGQPETGNALVAAATERFGGVDILMNNAGIFAPKPFLEHTEADFDRFLTTILKGKFFMAQAAAKAMQKRGGGAIVQTGSMWALQAIGATPSSAYSLANAGVHQMVKNLAIELASHNIRINAVAPAVVETPVYDTFIPADQVKGVLAGFNTFHPLGRNGQAEDIADALLFLASDAARWITGTVLPVDGGVMAGRA
jgi:NAD(P)-dependent dehydrogenase (short-subunit alcohol dehydrogenase family)